MDTAAAALHVVTLLGASPMSVAGLSLVVATPPNPPGDLPCPIHPTGLHLPLDPFHARVQTPPDLRRSRSSLTSPGSPAALSEPPPRRPSSSQSPSSTTTGAPPEWERLRPRPQLAQAPPPTRTPAPAAAPSCRLLPRQLRRCDQFQHFYSSRHEWPLQELPSPRHVAVPLLRCRGRASSRRPPRSQGRRLLQFVKPSFKFVRPRSGPDLLCSAAHPPNPPRFGLFPPTPSPGPPTVVFSIAMVLLLFLFFRNESSSGSLVPSVDRAPSAWAACREPALQSHPAGSACPKPLHRLGLGPWLAPPQIQRLVSFGLFVIFFCRTNLLIIQGKLFYRKVPLHHAYNNSITVHRN
ncbi:uncharacterized protein [Aegilops tauschii subsp. strangulata]|uniref:uncharacterized protein n=1 Tax=Aegilops tauschii subsp. strangulata TaxID=200361 RepID=UPI001E1CA2F0|nr:leucine-rich repeat extensin-like protein 5 [Aegilops tauschii subsp. strangulata]